MCKDAENEQEKSTNGVAYYINEFHKVQPDIKGKIIFRGQASDRWSIISSAGRRLEKEEKSKQNDFIRYHVNLIANARKFGYGALEVGSQLSDLEVLAEIQHYGGATCLIDFSTNFLVSLWMATENYQPSYFLIEEKGGEKREIFKKREIKNLSEETDGRIVWLDLGDKVNQSNILYYNKHKEGDTIQKLLAKVDSNFESRCEKVEPCYWLWEPTKLNNRIIKQDSIFLFGLAAFPQLDNDKIIAKETNTNRLSFKSITIRKEDKKKIRQDLESIFGLSAETVYYDLLGYSHNANNYSISVSDKILPKNDCLYNAKETIKKEQYSLAINYLEEALICKIGCKTCKRNQKTEKNECKNSIGELLFWKAVALKKRGEIEESLLYFYQSIKNLTEDLFELKLYEVPKKKYSCFYLYKDKKRTTSKKLMLLSHEKLKEHQEKHQKKDHFYIYLLLLEACRKTSIIHYSKFDYNSAIDIEIKLAKYSNPLKENWLYLFIKKKKKTLDNKNGIESIWALLELSIMTFDFPRFEKYKQKVSNLMEYQEKNLKKTNANILFTFLQETGNLIFKKTDINQENINKIFEKIDSIIKDINNKTEDNEISLIGYFYWNYFDFIDWIEHIRVREKRLLLTDEEFVETNANKLIILAQKARDAQNKLLNIVFERSSAIPVSVKDIKNDRESIENENQISDFKNIASINLLGQDKENKQGKNSTTEKGDKDFSIDALSNGTYIVEITAESKTTKKRIIKK